MNEPIYERMQQLIRQIRQADTAYYKHDAPIMSDLEYDRLMDDLVALEEESGVILSNSPTQHVAGETLETLMEVRHTKPMLSAAKTKSLEDLKRFASGRDVLLSWKMDGLTLVLRYENGHLKQAITRGRDGIIGEDVTHTVRTFLNVPLTIPILESFEVRGEGVISWKNFDAINAELKEYSPELATRPQIAVANKTDLLMDTAQLDAFRAHVEALGYEFFAMSAATHQGTRELVQHIARRLSELPPVTVYEPEYVPKPPVIDTTEPLHIEREDNTWLVEGPWLQRLMGNINFSDYESRMYFDKMLRQSGLFDTLEQMGIQDGDIVSMYDLEFEYQR